MLIKTNEFNLAHTIESGQIFRYQKVDSWYYITIRDRIVRLKQEKSNVHAEGAPKKFIEGYLGLGEDYKKVCKEIERHPVVKKSLDKYKGLRIIRQDPWECLVSFVCSSASNIPKIKRTLNRLSETFGKEISHNGYKSHTFPGPGEIKGINKVLKTGCGFRAKYLVEISKAVDEKWLENLKKIDYESAKKKLMELPGVGEKIADCVLLFSLGFGEAFPVDIWMKRIMEEEVVRQKMNNKNIAAAGRKIFGKNAGYAQQFLYHLRRLEDA